MADEIAEAGVACSIIYLDSPGGKLEARDLEWKNGAELEKRGGQCTLHLYSQENDFLFYFCCKLYKGVYSLEVRVIF